MFDPNHVREQFPIFKRRIKGKRLVYLDSAATTQKPDVVLETISKFYRTRNANVHRGVYTLSDEATESYETARASIAAFIGAETPQSIVFTRNATESINLVAASWGRKNLKPGDEVLLTMMEHHSNLIPWQLIAQQTGAKLKFIPLTPTHELDLTHLPQLLTDRTKFVSLVHISNALGTINPVKTVIDAAHRAGALVLVDASQSAPNMRLNVKELDCDFLAFSGHKVMAPTGIGVLYGKTAELDAMPPYMGGGEMIKEVQLEWSTYRELPGKFEAGTPNFGGAVALQAALHYLESIGFEALQQHERMLTQTAIKLLDEIGGITIYGPRNESRGGIVSFNIDGIHSHDVATVLDEDGVCIRAGHHCAQPLMRWLEVPSTVRASMYLYNTIEDIEQLAASIRRVKEIFSSVTL